MSQDNIVKLRCGECKEANYWTSKNKKTVERTLELKKFCRQCVKHTLHKESKKK